MSKQLKNSLVIVFVALLLASCEKVEITQTSPTQESQSTLTIIPVSHTPTPFLISAAETETPYPTTPAQATIEAYGTLCIGSKEISSSEISPNGKWIAALCYDENGKEESPLQVVSLDHNKEWKTYYRDYAKGHTGDRHDGIMPYRWSKDGKFLYTVAGSRLSGCCWIGGKYILLTRLNLETGEQTEIINGTDFGSDLPFSFTISENDQFLLFTPLVHQSYNFTVLDIQTHEAQVVNIKKEGEINLEFAIISPYEDIIVLPLFKNIEFNDYEVVSLLLIELNSKEQRILVSDLGKDKELYPIRWIDAEHILIGNANPFADRYFFDTPLEFWSLNINTGERVIVNNP
jgi:hypothetical protein